MHKARLRGKLGERALVLEGKVVLVTGGTSGIGAAMVSYFTGVGALVAYCARTVPEAREGQALPISADVSKVNDVSRLFDTVGEALGPISAVVHAAAILDPIGSICDNDPAAWLRAIEINLFGSFLITREACRRMRTRGGRIVLLSGGGASNPFPNYTAYACSKVAVVRLTETVAEEMKATGVEINCLAPGFVATPMHQATLRAGVAAGESYLERTLQGLRLDAVPPDLAARAAAFLISDAARGITGKFVSAVHDGWAEWPSHLSELADSDVFTLRRILPRERGMSWQ